MVAAAPMRISVRLSVLVLTGFCFPALATLGEMDTSVERDSTALHAVRAAVAVNATSHRMQELANARSTVHQYADATGRIFAVTWTGLGHPDLAVLFGSYYAEYQAAVQTGAVKRGGRLSSTQTNDLVVRLSGLPRHVGGLAYVPSLLPAGVDPRALK